MSNTGIEGMRQVAEEVREINKHDAERATYYFIANISFLRILLESEESSDQSLYNEALEVSLAQSRVIARLIKSMINLNIIQAHSQFNQNRSAIRLLENHGTAEDQALAESINSTLGYEPNHEIAEMYEY